MARECFQPREAAFLRMEFPGNRTGGVPGEFRDSSDFSFRNQSTGFSCRNGAERSEKVDRRFEICRATHVPGSLSVDSSGVTPALTAAWNGNRRLNGTGERHLQPRDTVRSESGRW